MIQLFLDGHAAIPTDSATIKLTVENSYFTKSTSYTYDVDLPLDIGENRRLFGFIGRIDVEKEARTFSARLFVDNVCVLAGTAHITSITEKSVKVQLLGSAASYNYGNKMDDTYIDELDMGDWFTTTWPDRYTMIHKVPVDLKNPTYWGKLPDDFTPSGVNSMVFLRACYNNEGKMVNLIDNLMSGEYPWVAFPTMNTSADVQCNDYHFKLGYPQGSGWENPSLSLTFSTYTGSGYFTDDRYTITAAIQPYVWIMAQKIAAATGFALAKEDNALFTNDLFKRIFIVNTNNFIECNRCLPHWSVNEWWTQIEQTFGLVISVDYSRRKMKLRHRADYYSEAEEISLKDIVDEFSCEVNSEQQNDISTDNVEFDDHDAGSEDELSEYILKTAEYNRDYESLTDILRNGPKSAAKNIIFDCRDGRRYIWSDDGKYVEVDMLRGRKVNDRSDAVITLKFVPAKFIDSEVRIVDETRPQDPAIGSVDVKMIAAPGIADLGWYKDQNGVLDIEAVLNEEEEEGDTSNSTEDLVYLAIAVLPNWMRIHVDTTVTTGKKIDQIVKFPRSLLRERASGEPDGLPIFELSPYSLSLIPITGQNNLASNTIVDSVKIDTTVRHCIRFIADNIPDPGSVFIIRNRRFVCEKIEADIDTHGLKRQLTGYFYELKDDD